MTAGPIIAAPASPSASPAVAPGTKLPPWARDLIMLYESNAASQFILYGNVGDRMVLPGDKPELGSLMDFLLRGMLPRFDVVLSYDIGNGIRVEKGNEIFSQWPALKEMGQLPRAPRQAIEAMTIFFRYAANLARLKRGNYHLGCVIRGASLVAPAIQGALNYDLSALASMIRDWSTDTLLAEHSLATFLITENLNDLHPLLVNNSRAAQVKIPLPPPEELCEAFRVLSPSYPTSLQTFAGRTDQLATQLAGASTASVEGLLKTTEYRRQPLCDADIVALKKQLVEQDCNGLIEFTESKRTFDDLQGQEKVKAWLRQDFALWRQNDLPAVPMGYLLCGPVGTGKTFTAECLAGEAGVPVVKLKNFRDKWVGSTEGNLEKIFRLLHALNRCFVFIDEADQALGKRDAQSGDSGTSGRVYSMMAEEMSNQRNRGKIIWVLASSRPDLIEVDLKRPGRIDVKIPLLPTSTAAESLELLCALCRRKGLTIDTQSAGDIKVPLLLTPGAADTLASKVYRSSRTQSLSPLEALKACLVDYRNPVPQDVMEFQIGIAVREASDVDFIPQAFRNRL
jgi:ATPase family associated with various cellular activities (AAA)